MAAVVCGYFSTNNGQKERRAVHLRSCQRDVHINEHADKIGIFDCVKRQQPGWSEEKTPFLARGNRGAGG